MSVAKNVRKAPSTITTTKSIPNDQTNSKLASLTPNSTCCVASQTNELQTHPKPFLAGLSAENHEINAESSSSVANIKLEYTSSTSTLTFASSSEHQKPQFNCLETNEHEFNSVSAQFGIDDLMKNLNDELEELLGEKILWLSSSSIPENNVTHDVLKSETQVKENSESVLSLNELNEQVENLENLNPEDIIASDSFALPITNLKQSNSCASISSALVDVPSNTSKTETDSVADADSDSELIFDPNALEPDVFKFDDDEDDEESENSKLLDTICSVPLPNRLDVFNNLHKIHCPHKLIPYVFLAQNKKTVEHIFNALANAPKETELAADPEGLDVSLMQHQKHALTWMQFCEKRFPYGGLLADDMGLGKTLTLLSLVMAEKNRLENGETDDDWNPSNGGTLVICPASLLRQWENEVNTKFCFALMPLVFHGNVDHKDLKRLRSFDIVITTYDSLINGRLASHLKNMCWRRIILDEAHVIRNPKTLRSEAVCSLRAKFRWALTGTPVHNKESDVFGILKFLRYAPFDERGFWNSWALDHQRLTVLLRSIMLRRTKAELQKYNPLFKLPPREEETITIILSEPEMLVHQTVLSFSKDLVSKYILQHEQRRANAGLGTELHVRQMQRSVPEPKYTRDYKEFVEKLSGDLENIGQHVILVLLLRLTQICCHPDLARAMRYDYVEENLANENSLLSSTSKKNNFENVKQLQDYAAVRTSCTNVCKRKELQENEEPPCKKSKNDPSVREILSLKNPVFDPACPSSKMLEVMRILQERVLRTKDKAVIVSQWTGFLSIMEDFLYAEGIRSLSFNGKMSLEEREQALSQFNCSASDVKVLLLSLKCGGVGLNLTAANHLILLDLHWNPQMEAQAQDRIYRLGQKKSVFVYKFLCHDTIEERIQMVQEDKLKLAENLLTGAKNLKTGFRLTIRDLKKLFNID